MHNILLLAQHTVKKKHINNCTQRAQTSTKADLVRIRSLHSDAGPG